MSIQSLIDNAVLNSVSVDIVAGEHILSQTAEMDLSGVLTQEPATQRQRPDIRGQGSGVTVLKSSTAGQPALKVIGGTGVAAHGYMSVADMSFGPQVDHANGLHLSSLAFVECSNVSGFGLDIGLKLESVLSSTVYNSEFRSCRVGMDLAKGSGFSGVNAVKIEKTSFGLCGNLGIQGNEFSTNLHFDNCNFEGCGIQANPWCGGAVITFSGAEGCAGATFTNCYFEGNKGQFDVRLVNSGARRMTATFIGCTFNRVSMAGFVNRCVEIYGAIDVTLIGCAFSAYGDYVESPSRPHIWDNGGARWRIINCSPLADH